MTQQLDKLILIKSPVKAVWQALTNVDLMKVWAAEPSIQIEIKTDWKIGTPFIIKGFHHTWFENKGTVLQCIPERLLQYNFLSSLSKLPAIPENHTIVTFTLTPSNNDTSLILTLQNFPTETILKHLDFYWNSTLKIMKDMIEGDRRFSAP